MDALIESAVTTLRGLANKVTARTRASALSLRAHVVNLCQMGRS